MHLFNNCLHGFSKVPRYGEGNSQPDRPFQDNKALDTPFSDNNRSPRIQQGIDKERDQPYQPNDDPNTCLCASKSGQAHLNLCAEEIRNWERIVRASLGTPAYIRYPDEQVRRVPWNSQIWNLPSLQEFLHSFTDIYLPEPANLIAIQAALQEDEKLHTRTGSTIDPLRVIQQSGLQLQVFLVENGRFLVPQPSLRDCTYAAEATLLLQQGYLSPENAGKVFVTTDHRRDDDGLIRSLRKRTGTDRVVVIANKGDFKLYLAALRKGLQEYGPCILNQGHAFILDAIDECDGVILHIREPFHGTLLEVRQVDKQSHDQSMDLYNESPYKLDINLRWYEQAIFLRPYDS